MEPQKPLEKAKESHPIPTPKKLNPVRSTLEIIALYAVLGIIWIYTSDTLLTLLIRDPDLIDQIQHVKGIFYVLATALLFYLIIKKRMSLYFDSILHLNQAVTDLETSNANLTELEIKLSNLAYFDPLTGLLSRNKLIEKVQDHLRDHPGEILGFVYIDVDNFKNVNELKGHETGDELIRLVAEEIVKVAPPPHEIGRLSSDEFIILLKGLPDRASVEATIRENASRIGKMFLLGGEEFFVTVSAGISLYPENGDSFESLLQQSNMALNVAKDRGKNQIVMFQPDFQSKLLKQIELGNLLHQALPNHEFTVHYQPIYNVLEKRFTALEALIRWKHPVRGFIPPLDFIPIAEMSWMINDLTWFVFEECFRQGKAWRSAKLTTTISINLSAKVLAEDRFLDTLTGLLEKYEVQPRDYAIEVTESAILEHIEESILRLEALKKMGFLIALDDFGTGYSSLTYLMKLPIQVVKIDRGFIETISAESIEIPFLHNIIHLAHEMGLAVISEGVEKDYQKTRLEDYGTDFIQGYYFARPMDADAVERFLRDHNPE